MRFVGENNARGVYIRLVQSKIFLVLFVDCLLNENRPIFHTLEKYFTGLDVLMKRFEIEGRHMGLKSRDMTLVR